MILSTWIVSTLLALSPVIPNMGAKAKKGDDIIAAVDQWNREIFEEIAPSIVVVSHGDGTGTGFFVSNDGLILTNAHVVKKKKTVRVAMRSGKKFKGTVVERARGDIDLALVKIDGVKTKPLTLSSADARLGRWVGTIGHGLGFYWSFLTGTISNIYTHKEKKIAIIQTQVPINPGNSGGPLFDRKGNVVGVVTAGIEGANSINFAIKIDVAFRSLKKLPKGFPEVSIRAPKGRPIFVDGKAVGTGPKVVVSLPPGKHKIMMLKKGKKVTKTITVPNTKEVVLD